jgi:hypothetical protein
VDSGEAQSGDTAWRVGRVGFITMITAMRPFATVLLRTHFWVTSRFPSLLAISPMKAVHFLHWNILTDIPYNGPPQLAERPDHPYLIWGTVFNGVNDPYIEGFVVHVPIRIWLIWGTSYRFPGTGSVSTLVKYIHNLTWHGGYSYFAYPDATVRTVLSAMEIQKEHAFLLSLAQDNRRSGAEFTRAYRGFLTRCQGIL